MSNGRAKLLFVAGARPNFMKVAPLLAAAAARGRIEARLVHTGQHYDAALSDVFFRDLGIPAPDHHLGVAAGTHVSTIADILRALEPVIATERPDAAVVVGDVNSTLAAALAAVKMDVPVAHVEAGLRSFDRTMPEEVNRIIVDSISTWLFVTEPSGRTNLLREGAPPDRIHLVGNTMIDTLLRQLERARATNILRALALEPRRYAVLTLHRPSNVDDPARLASVLGALARAQSLAPIIFPVHPRTRARLESPEVARALAALPQLRPIAPLGYLEFLALMDSAAAVLTDSGGIQEETTALGVPCVTMRDTTERPITVEQGTNVLAGTDPQAIARCAEDALARGLGLAGEAGVPARLSELGDGSAAERILDVLEAEVPPRDTATA